MRFDEFLDASYTLSSKIAECSRTVNWQLERIQSDRGKASYWLKRSPGVQNFVTMGIQGFVRGMFSLNGHCYAVVGTNVVEIMSDATIINYSVSSGLAIPDDGLPVSFAANPTQLMITSGGNGYILSMAALQQITDADFPTGYAGQCEFLDGYFIVLLTGINPITGISYQQFQVSALNDGLSWNASKVTSVESRPDAALACIVANQELWVFGGQTVQVYYDNGDVGFPFVSRQDAVVEQGIVAPASIAKMDNTLYWLGGNEQGQGVLWRMRGYLPEQVSDYSFERSIQAYSRISDATAWTFQLDGHFHYRLTFPSANGGLGSTWDYDAHNRNFTEISSWNGLTQQEESHVAYHGVSAFGKILCGSRLIAGVSPKIMEMKQSFLDDDGTLIRRLRRAPHLRFEGKQVVYRQIRFDGNTGIGLVGEDDSDSSVDPKFILRWSDDGGQTWSNDREIRAGKVGQYSTIMNSFSLGIGRDRVFETVHTEMVDWSIDDVSLDAEVLAN